MLEYSPELLNQWTNVGKLEAERAYHGVLSIGPQLLRCMEGCLELSAQNSFHENLISTSFLSPFACLFVWLSHQKLWRQHFLIKNRQPKLVPQARTNDPSRKSKNRKNETLIFMQCYISITSIHHPTYRYLLIRSFCGPFCWFRGPDTDLHVVEGFKELRVFSIVLINIPPNLKLGI